MASIIHFIKSVNEFFSKIELNIKYYITNKKIDQFKFVYDILQLDFNYLSKFKSYFQDNLKFFVHYHLGFSLLVSEPLS